MDAIKNILSFSGMRQRIWMDEDEESSSAHRVKRTENKHGVEGAEPVDCLVLADNAERLQKKEKQLFIVAFRIFILKVINNFIIKAPVDH